MFTDNKSAVLRISQQHPTYKVVAVDEPEGLVFVKTHCAAVSPAYQVLEPMAFKADIFRYCALWKFGGYYVDDDLLLDGTLDELTAVKGSLLVVTDHRRWRPSKLRRSPWGIWQAVIAARSPGHRALSCALSRIASGKTRAYRDVLEVTGPWLLGRCTATNDDTAVVGDLKHGPECCRGQAPECKPQCAVFPSGKIFARHMRVPRTTKHYGELWQPRPSLR